MKKKDIERRKKFILELLGDPIYKPMRLREISTLLRLSKEEKRDLYDVLDELCYEGKVSVDNKGRYEKVKGKWKKKKDDRYYDDRREEYGADHGKKKKDKLKDKNRDKAKEKSRGRNRDRDFREEDSYKEEYLEGIQAEGTFIGHPKGFGFVEIEGQEEDIFIPESDTGTAMHQDKVRIIIRDGQKEGKRKEGVVVKVLERGMPEIVGTYQLNRDFGFVISDNPKFSKDIFIPRKEAAGIKNGDKVIAVITDYGSKNKNPEGKIKENLGNIRTPGTDILAIVKSFGIPSEFPEKVMKQAQRVPDHVLDADRDGRLDLRHLQTVTIDGEDAKDLDDAISLTKEGDIYHLGVHIADVSNYVQYNSALDKEALKRGTSVYLADRVVPMLPERLSNGICSLNQGEDRLALSCLMDINEKGKVVSHQIAETVINVNERMCYTDVKNILEDTDEDAKKRYEELIPMFFMMKELSGILRNSRHHRGSIDFDFPESKIILNAAGKAIDVKPYEANVATKIIEDFMLMANETVAQEYCTEEIPFVYRTHDNPDPEKVESLLTLLHNQGVKIQKAKEEITPKEIQQIIESIEGLPNEAMISRLVLRSMKQAKYTTECSGHFGLAAKYYCHFTSPIRRYPDLQIHRIIKDNLRGRLMREGRTEHYAEILDEVARQSSVCERRADEAERESDKLKKAEYMSYHLGEEFEGIISGVTGWGLYVELPNTVEGLVHVNTLRDDYYIFDQETYELRGEMTKKVYKLGDKVRVRVADADKMLKTVDFELVSNVWDNEEEN
ncbi:MAG: ribonuclease R [Blautia sp.]|uniref:ribonuclease R n=1 Tax=unclassified Blautia TaxID=2648079 RepID=UPI001C11D14C|nr:MULTISPECIES: ribonuclease R [unclassified Blautia]MBU5680457.1 ribonuclease R [Blautia sp. MSJ-9]MCI6301824.1 ribonuclease R [Blautia sp.]MCI7450870.1 ribonuclease R [Blautia sp.]MDD6414622.1 ribonuclease R [Blautia sp.]